MCGKLRGEKNVENCSEKNVESPVGIFQGQARSQFSMTRTTNTVKQRDCGKVWSGNCLFGGTKKKTATVGMEKIIRRKAGVTFGGYAASAGTFGRYVAPAVALRRSATSAVTLLVEPIGERKKPQQGSGGKQPLR